MFIWDKETEEILKKYTNVSESTEDFEELELEKLKLRLLLKSIESAKTMIEAEERGDIAKQKLSELCYAFSFASLLDRKKRMRKKIEKTKELLKKLDNITTRGEFYEDLVKKTKEQLNQYTTIESKPTIKRQTVEQVLVNEINNKISKTKKQIIKRAITATLRPEKEVRVLLDKKNFTVITESTKLQYESEKAISEIEEIFKIKEVFGISLSNINSPLVIDIKRNGEKIVADITEKIFEGNHIKTKNHYIILNA